MTPSILRPAKIVYPLLLILTISITCATQSVPAAAKEAKGAKDDPAYQDAMELYDQGRFVDAMPLFEKLAATYSSDPVPHEGWAWCLMEYAATLPDPEQRKKVRIRARTVALKAKELGDNSQLLQVVLEIPEDGAEPTFSDRKEIDDTMRAAEADFARGDLDKARQGYLRALLLDPNYYEAALFIGDVYFKQHVYGSAGEWFTRAISIDPNRETAYRYWGDALAAMGNNDLARAKFIEAIVAEPYKRTSWVGLTNWLNRNKLQLNELRLKDGAAVNGVAEAPQITIDSSIPNDTVGRAAWVGYAVCRTTHRIDASAKSSKYRRTLAEEADCLNSIVRFLKENPKKLKDIDPSLQSLIKIQEMGFLEPFVLLNRADSEIAQDYEAYRAANREKIRRYLDEFVVPKAPAPTN